MTYKQLKVLIKVSLTNWSREPWKCVRVLVVPTFQYWDDGVIKKVNKKFKGYKIEFLRTDNAVFPSQIRITKKK